MAAIAWSGSPNLSGADDFAVSCSDVPNQQFGLLFWGHASQSIPFLGGKLCVVSPLQREAVALSGGNAGGSDCSGQFVQAFGHAGMVERGWIAGSSVFAQYWLRDPLHPDGTGVGLSNALAFVVGP